MDIKVVLKIRIAALLSKYGHLSARVIANRLKIDISDVSEALADMIEAGHVYAEDSGREWRGQPVHVFSAIDIPKAQNGKSWDRLIAAIQKSKLEKIDNDVGKNP